ncbi:GntR family transcriptional regulator/MocR family aminotransferase [Naumannella cuiyingiana]|uniref:GntR family transcriptional regulator/MocR family aminotransferase n=1 Tax=Naumannella cuiyingiana TaxID=1347891 RepID=A0A7Z0D6U1_9ACTN|nr:PLP-dependent aminotransferase family protein [Naumannella cuiyingiana]NYI69953.1 GntR family transcriptional regulator/MocR family aminotransferase [Naumannella cuiyingiana]
MPRTPRASALALDLGAVRRPEALVDAIMREIARGRLGPGDPLPSTRALAARLGVSRAGVVSAYEALAASGVIDVRAGSGATVAIEPQAAAALTEPALAVRRRERLEPPPGSRRRPELTGIRHNLLPGAPDPRLVDVRDWRRAWRRATQGVPPVLAYWPAEHPELAAALATQLRRTRQIATPPEEIVIFPGVNAAVQAVLAALRPHLAAIEDPGYPAVRAALAPAVEQLRMIGVDEHGLRTDELTDEDLVYVTPAHQFPLGARMSTARREALLRWAERRSAVIIEDDFDGEYRHESAPLGPLRSTARGADCVIYIGTASKILTPHLRLAWAVLPTWLADAVRAAAVTLRADASRLASLALAELINSGALTRHLARAQRTYAARRRRLVEALATRLPDLHVIGVDAGIHVAALLPDAIDDAEVAARCLARGVAVAALSDHAVRHRRSGLLLGYAQLAETAAADAVERIAAALESAGTPGSA